MVSRGKSETAVVPVVFRVDVPAGFLALPFYRVYMLVSGIVTRHTDPIEAMLDHYRSD
jgi:hypothetical protein